MDKSEALDSALEALGIPKVKQGEPFQDPEAYWFVVELCLEANQQDPMVAEILGSEVEHPKVYIRIPKQEYHASQGKQDVLVELFKVKMGKEDPLHHSRLWKEHARDTEDRIWKFITERQHWEKQDI